jgi:hypothetical protein
MSDIEAAHGLDIPAIFIEGDPTTQKAGAGKAATEADAVCASLLDAVNQYLR